MGAAARVVWGKSLSLNKVKGDDVGGMDANERKQIWPFPNSIPGVDCMRYGNYGLMASSKGGPPHGSPQEVHFTSYSEPGKWVWLTWEGVEH